MVQNTTHIDINPEDAINKISQVFRIKDGSVKSPDMYLGIDVRKRIIQDTDGNQKTCFSLGANTYVKEAVRIAKSQVIAHELSFPISTKKSGSQPFTHVKYRPELDASDYCDDEKHTLYQNFIGMLRLMCELGRIDILHETSLLSQYLAQPRIVHLKQAINRWIHQDLTWSGHRSKMKAVLKNELDK